MGANKSVILPNDEVESICEETGFKPKELQRLYVRFQELERRTPPTGFLSREDLMNVREVALNPLGERLVDVIIQDHGFSSRFEDRENSSGKFSLFFSRRNESNQFPTICSSSVAFSPWKRNADDEHQRKQTSLSLQCSSRRKTKQKSIFPSKICRFVFLDLRPKSRFENRPNRIVGNSQTFSSFRMKNENLARKTAIFFQVGGNIQEEQIATIADHTIGELVR